MVWLQEVGPRDGLQNEPRVLSAGQRAHLIEALGDAGLPRIQIGSFVNPRRVPQMADTDLVWQRLNKKPGIRYSVLVLNAKGLELALSEGIPHVEIYVSASESHSMKNSGVTVEQATGEAVSMIQAALSNGRGVTAGVMCAFGCFSEEPIAQEKVVELVAALEKSSLTVTSHRDGRDRPESRWGRFGWRDRLPFHPHRAQRRLKPGEPLPPTEIALADTAGMSRPGEVQSLISALKGMIDINRLTLHLHDTRGFGMANLVAALEIGVRRFDTSVGGLGGCPFIPGAVGNISTEAVASTLHARGYRTGVDVQRVRDIKGALEGKIETATGGGRIKPEVA